MNTNDGALHGQTAVVTGAGRGIGRAIAKALAARGAGVALIARNANELAESRAEITSAGGRAKIFVADVTDIAAIASAMKQIEESLGAADLLVNNAGVLQPIGPFWENDLNEWLRGIDVNLRGVAICSRAVMPGMVARGRGRIINVSSGAGLGMGLDYMSSYVTSKTAVLRFTDTSRQKQNRTVCTRLRFLQGQCGQRWANSRCIRPREKNGCRGIQSYTKTGEIFLRSAQRNWW